MTTVDAYISKVELEFHSGIWGPATALMRRFMQGIEDGSVRGGTDGGSIRAYLSGQELREVLVGFDPSGGYPSSADQAAFEAFVASIDDEAQFEFHTFEI